MPRQTILLLNPKTFCDTLEKIFFDNLLTAENAGVRINLIRVNLSTSSVNWYGAFGAYLRSDEDILKKYWRGWFDHICS